MTLSGRDVALLSAAIVPVIVVFFFFDAYPQAADYYDFADVRTAYGIANFWNVASNALFLIFGVAGLLRGIEWRRHRHPSRNAGCLHCLVRRNLDHGARVRLVSPFT